MSSKEKLPSLTQFSSDRPEIEACELVFVTWQIPNLVLEKNLYQLIMLQSSAECLQRFLVPDGQNGPRIAPRHCHSTCPKKDKAL